MKLYIAPVLMCLALAAPQQHVARDTKPFKEPSGACWNDGDTPLFTDDIFEPTEDCVGTLKYCRDKHYQSNGENFRNPDECFGSRGRYPKKGADVLNKSEYHDAVRDLEKGNALYNRYHILQKLNGTILGDGPDPDSTAAISKLLEEYKSDLQAANQSWSLAAEQFQRAFAKNFSQQIDEEVQRQK